MLGMAVVVGGGADVVVGGSGGEVMRTVGVAAEVDVVAAVVGIDGEEAMEG